MFQGCFKGVSRTLRKFHEWYETVSILSLNHIKSFLKNICFGVVVVAASRAEGGLVQKYSDRQVFINEE